MTSWVNFTKKAPISTREFEFFHQMHIQHSCIHCFRKAPGLSDFIGLALMSSSCIILPFHPSNVLLLILIIVFRLCQLCREFRCASTGTLFFNFSMECIQLKPTSYILTVFKEEDLKFIHPPYFTCNAVHCFRRSNKNYQRLKLLVETVAPISIEIKSKMGRF